MATKAKSVSPRTRVKKVKVAHSLFDYAGGATEAPSDPVVVDLLTKSIDSVMLRLRPLDSESKLKLVRRIAKAANSVSQMFNVAVFVRDKEHYETKELFAKPTLRRRS